MKDVYCPIAVYGWRYGIRFLGNGCGRLFRHYVDCFDREGEPEYTDTIPISVMEKVLGFSIEGSDSIPQEQHSMMEEAYNKFIHQ